MARTKQVLEKKGGKARRKTTEVVKKPKATGKAIKKSSAPPTKEKGEKKRKSQVDAEKKERKPRKFKASTIAAREIKKWSGKNGTKLCFQKKPFQNLVREILQYYDDTLRIKKTALLDIQEGMESWLKEGMERTHPLCQLAKKMAPTAKILRMATEPIFYGEAPKS